MNDFIEQSRSFFCYLNQNKIFIKMIEIQNLPSNLLNDLLTRIVIILKKKVYFLQGF